MLLKMKNGGILDITQDNQYIQGCPTCDYGSEYISEMQIKLTNIYINVEANSKCNYSLSDGLIMKIILPNVNEIQEMSELEFAKWFEDQLLDKIEQLEYDVIEIRKEK